MEPVSSAADVRIAPGTELEAWAPETSGGRLRALRARLVGGWPGLVTLLAVFLSWEAIVRSLHVAVIYVPAPSSVFGEILGSLDFYADSTRVTLLEAGLGFLIGWACALVAALLMAEFRI